MSNCKAHSWRPSALKSDTAFCDACGRVFVFEEEPAFKVASVKSRLIQMEVAARKLQATM